LEIPRNYLSQLEDSMHNLRKNRPKLTGYVAPDFSAKLQNTEEETPATDSVGEYLSETEGITGSG
jgi:hypothetical protein